MYVIFPLSINFSTIYHRSPRNIILKLLSIRFNNSSTDDSTRAWLILNHETGSHERYTRETHFFEYENISKIRLKNVNVCKKGGERKLKSEEEKLPGTTCCWDKEGYFRFPKRTSTLSLSRLPMETSGRTC